MKPNKEIRYHLLISKDTSMCGPAFWKRKYNTDVTNRFLTAVQATKETRLRIMNFKILHNIWPTNILLKRMKLKPSENCEKCNVKDYIEHFFFHCKQIRSLWHYVKTFIINETGCIIKIDEQTALLGIDDTTHPNVNKNDISTINRILLLAKVCISKFRYGQQRNINDIF